MTEAPAWRTISTGRCYVYVFPCRERDSLKIGYARDPWIRLQAFHSRFHVFFDLDRAALLEVERVKEARHIESMLKSKFSSAADTAPLEVRERAGGKFEWFRGIHPEVIDELQSMSAQLGYPMCAPLDEWLGKQWTPHIPRLIDWIEYEFEQIEAWNFNANPSLIAPRQRALRNRIDAWESIGLSIVERLPRRIRKWLSCGFAE